ncbi:MAG: serine dehydratase subunit alpha family protein [Acetivibrionales bacterium]|jgi:L-cysteine desulfidase
MDIKKILNLLKKEMVVAMGCTEPAASALAGAKAFEILGCEPEKINIYASRDMIKNAMGVGIPNCSMRGIQAAVCLGISGGDPENKLSILKVITEEQQKKAAEYLSFTELKMVEDVPPVYIKVELLGGGHSTECEISYEHDKFTSLKKDGVELQNISRDDINAKSQDHIMSREELIHLTLSDIVKFAETIPPNEIAFVLEGARINMELARHSAENSYGLTVGKIVLQEIQDNPKTLSEAVDRGAGLAAAASDARMSGCSKAVVINSGSGNQGITCSVPVIALAEYLGASELDTTRALCISQLVALTLTARKERLSALCGAFTAAIGASCGFIYLLGGTQKQMDMAMRTMVANLTGIICDGAKDTCALKIYSCLEAAGLSCKLAMADLAPSSESGIVGDDSNETVKHLARICHEGMLETDKTILSIMLE